MQATMNLPGNSPAMRACGVSLCKREGDILIERIDSVNLVLTDC